MARGVLAATALGRLRAAPPAGGNALTRRAFFTGSNLDGTSDLVSWVNANCQVVQVGSGQTRTGLELYDCAA